LISFFTHEGVELSYRDSGEGMSVVFQHGLGGDEKQVADVFPEMPGIRRITLECRGQGHSSFGPPEQLSIRTFADDLDALADKLGFGAVVVGGISMGAAIALRLAVHRPGRVRALVLARPAWVVHPAPANMKPYALVGDLLLRHPAEEARRRFDETGTAMELVRSAPDNLASLRGFFARPDAAAFGQVLQAIASDGPGVEESEVRAINVPTLVIGHDQDLAHPFANAKALVALIPNAQLCKITPKGKDPSAYRRDFRECLADFLGTLK
jgi:pimeloyl-ACP methyl ester carboxylesterase